MCADDSQFEGQTITLNAANGISFQCRILGVFHFEQQTYVLLMKLTENGDGESKVVMELMEKDDGATLRVIETDEQFARVIEFIREFLEERQERQSGESATQRENLKSELFFDRVFLGPDRCENDVADDNSETNKQSVVRPSVGVLIGQLGHTDLKVVENAVESLIAMGAGVIWDLIEVVNDNRRESQRGHYGREALVRIGEPAVLALIRNGDEGYSWSDEVIVRIGRPAVTTLIAVIKEERERFNGRLSDILSKMGECVVPDLIEAAATSGASELFYVLGKFGDRAVLMFIESLNSQSVSVRRGAARCLEKTRADRSWELGSAVVAALRRASKDSDDVVRKTAIRARRHRMSRNRLRRMDHHELDPESE